MVNKYAARCESCGSTVPANGGTIRKVGRRWVARHLDCSSGVVSIRFNSGATMSVNAHGRCEDAPCCGCCTS